ncbi:N-acetyltransferase [Lactiplantibacillus garii]|uniref:N-acetyltransferase n=1 Tax=Lactiplantibacillus garii TaxID=2306423 RepID=A0A3R8KM42_9LACO|nr:GNAT family N-acetyltransferase [Lactiplantibacillus garii]RRK10872.1 N-acetyltransferase [Lactiplantibacillus garii]
MLTVRKFQDQDANAVTHLVAKTLRSSNAADYSAAYLNKLVQRMTPAWFCERAAATHFYVICAGPTIIATGAIGPYWGRQDESSLFTIFVDPQFQGRGCGRLIINTLEADPYFKRAHRIEIPASITAVNFYRRMGYHVKAGGPFPDEEGLYRLEKFRSGEG